MKKFMGHLDHALCFACKSSSGFFFAIVDKIDIMIDAWRTRLVNLMRKVEASRIKKPASHRITQNRSQRHRGHGPPNSLHLKAPTLNGRANEENDLTRVQDDRGVPVGPDYAIEAEPHDNGDAVHVSNDTSTDSQDEPHGDPDKDTDFKKHS
jgi:hypothetical protein